MIIVGITGPSCSGKTTIARIAAQLLNTELVHADKHHIKNATRPIVNGYPSYERPDQYDMDAALKYAQSTPQKHVICIEGFHLFNNINMLDATNLRYYVDVPFNICLQRRQQRSQQPSYDGVWKDGARPDIDAGFMAHGEQEWTTFGAPQQYVENCIILDGTIDPMVNAKRIIADVLRHTEPPITSHLK